MFAKRKHSDAGVRRAAVKTLRQLPPEVLATHAPAVVAKLEDSDEGVRWAAVETLGKLPPEALAIGGDVDGVSHDFEARLSYQLPQGDMSFFAGYRRNDVGARGDRETGESGVGDDVGAMREDDGSSGRCDARARGGDVG